MSYTANSPQSKWCTYVLDSVTYTLAPIQDWVGNKSTERVMTEAEALQRAKDEKVWNAGAVGRKLGVVKDERLTRLPATDYMSNSDVTMPEYIKTWRQLLRDIPANHTDEAAYDLLLARDVNAETGVHSALKHEIWTQPTS